MSTKYLALTFDDGPDRVITPKVLDILEKHQVTGSFFLIGKNITEDTEDIVRRTVEMGFETENHSYSHVYMDKLSPQEIKEDVEKSEEIICRITGRKTKFFRPPYLAVSEEMYDNIDRCFIGGLHCEDWDDGISAAERADRIVGQAIDGAIILLHDMKDNEATVEALDMMIPGLKDRGFDFVTVEEMFRKRKIDPKEKNARHRVFDIVKR